MQTVKEAVTKAFTKPLSLALPVFSFSHRPKASKAPSRFRSSPMTPPTVRHSTSSILPPLEIAPFSTLSIFSNAPAMPIIRVLTPQHLLRVSWTFSFKNLPKRIPARPPATMAPVLMIVPKPYICVPSLFFDRKHLTPIGEFCQ